MMTQQKKAVLGDWGESGEGGLDCASDCDVTGKMPLSGMGREKPGALSA